MANGVYTLGASAVNGRIIDDTVIIDDIDEGNATTGVVETTEQGTGYDIILEDEWAEVVILQKKVINKKASCKK